jgi:hypothetical protein
MAEHLLEVRGQDRVGVLSNVLVSIFVGKATLHKPAIVYKLSRGQDDLKKCRRINGSS